MPASEEEVLRSPVPGEETGRSFRARRYQSYGSLPGRYDDLSLDPTSPPPRSVRRESRSMIFSPSDLLGMKETFASVRAAARRASHQFSRMRMRTVLKPRGADKAGDFQVVDLVNENFRSYTRSVGQTTSSSDLLLRLYVLLTVMAVGTGLIATLLDFTVEWLGGLKAGVCWSAPYLTRDACCEATEDIRDCPSFVRWSAILPIGILSPGLVDFGVYLGLAMIFAGLAARLVMTLAPYAAGSGIPEVKTVLSGVSMTGFLSAWTLLIKVVGLTLSVASSLNLGKEGPFVHLSSCLGFVLDQRFKLLERNGTFLRELISCCCAAGVAVAFGAPIGGVLFVFEEAASYFPSHVLWRCFYASTVAALTLKTANPFFNGKSVMFEVEYTETWFWFEMIAFALLGTIGGIIGGFFIQFNVLWSKFRLHSQAFRRHPVREALAVVVATVLLSYPVPFLRHSNSTILSSLLNDCSIKTQNELLPGSQADYALLCDQENHYKFIAIMVYAIVNKLALTVFTFGLRVPAGLFVPSLTIGACVGRLLGTLLERFHTSHADWVIFAECGASSMCIQPGLYAIIGAGAVLGGVTQVSVSITVIIFELTGGLKHLLPTMVAILFAKVVASNFGIPSIYDSHVLLKRYPCLEKDVSLEHDAPCRRVMRPNVRFVVATGETVSALDEMLHETVFYVFPVIDNTVDMNLVGSVVRPELEDSLEKAKALDWVTPNTRVNFDVDNQVDFVLEERENSKSLNFGPSMDYYCATTLATTPISQVYNMFSSMGIRHCLVTENGKLVGVITKKDLLAFVDITEGVPKKFFL